MKRKARRYRPGQSLKPFRWPWLWVGLWMLAIIIVVIGSLMPSPDLPSMPAGSDKLQHFAAYFLLSASAAQLFARRLALFSACIVIGLLGLGLEHAQGAMGLGRHADAGDVLANMLGILAGLATTFTPLRDVLLRIDGGHNDLRS